MQLDTAVLLGAGAFGTALASIASERFELVVAKVRSQELKTAINRGENPHYLPGKTLPTNLRAVTDWLELDALLAQRRVELLISGLPMAALRPFFTEYHEHLDQLLARGAPFVSLAKGIDSETFETSDEIFAQFFPSFIDSGTYLSGPSFAEELFDRQATIVQVAGTRVETTQRVADALRTASFRAIPSPDVKGVLLGGALKNVLAIAGGILEGLGYNHNTRAALITQGMAEMSQFGRVYGALPETFASFSGLGDLILTTTGGLSRNKTFGLEIARGRSVPEVLKASRGVVEGYRTTAAVHALADRHALQVPIFESVHTVLYQGASPELVVEQLMQ